MEDFLNQLSIATTGRWIEDNYVIDISSYDEFSAIYNKLEQSTIIVKDSDESSFNADNAHVTYLSDNYQVILNGDLVNDVYQLMITEL